ncbi:hypothetical protein DK871_20185 [Pseudomonas sp. L13]|nr:hypothetical protein [Pseudomonas sp. L13]
MLAKNSRTPRSFWMCASSLPTFASKLAPTGDGLRSRPGFLSQPAPVGQPSSPLPAAVAAA